MSWLELELDHEEESRSFRRQLQTPTEILGLPEEQITDSAVIFTLF